MSNARQRRADRRAQRDGGRAPTARQLRAVARMSRELHRQAPAVTTRQGASAVIDALARLGARPPAKRPERANLTLTRERAQTVTCPRCHAQPGEPCIGVSRHDGQRRARKAPHVERYRAVTALLERSPP